MRTITIKEVFNPDNKQWYWVATITNADGTEVPEILRLRTLDCVMEYVGRYVGRLLKKDESIILRRES